MVVVPLAPGDRRRRPALSRAPGFRRAPVSGLPRFGAVVLVTGNAVVPTPGRQASGSVRRGLQGDRRGVSRFEWGREQGGQVDVLRTDAVGGIEPRVETSPWTFVAASELPTPAPAGGRRPHRLPPVRPPARPRCGHRPRDLSAPRRSPASSPTRMRARSFIPACSSTSRVPGNRGLRTAWSRCRGTSCGSTTRSSRTRSRTTSPFLGVRDLYPVQRLPLTDGANPPRGSWSTRSTGGSHGAVMAAPDRGP